MGTLKYQGAMPCTLHEARLLIYPDSTCKKMTNSTGNNASAITNAFCAGYMNGGIDTCQVRKMWLILLEENSLGFAISSLGISFKLS